MSEKKLVKKFNEKYPVGARVMWRSFAKGYAKEKIVSHEAFISPSGDAATRFEGKSGYCSIDPNFVDYEFEFEEIVKSPIRKIKVEHEDLTWDCILEFDTSCKTVHNNKTSTLDDNLKLSLEFFMGGKERVEDADGDLVIAYAKFIGDQIINASQKLNMDGVIREFNDAEGYLPLDGSFGVKLVRMDQFGLDGCFSAEEIK